MLTETIRKFLLKQKLGYVATVSSEGYPNISPKGTIFVWDDSNLVFANIRSPDTIKNLHSNPRTEINVIDPLSRRGFLFVGEARIIQKDEFYEKVLSFYRDIGIKSKISDIVLVNVLSVSEVTSPLYDMGVSEGDVRKTWRIKLLDDN